VQRVTDDFHQVQIHNSFNKSNNDVKSGGRPPCFPHNATTRVLHVAQIVAGAHPTTDQHTTPHDASHRRRAAHCAPIVLIISALRTNRTQHQGTTHQSCSSLGQCAPPAQRERRHRPAAPIGWLHRRRASQARHRPPPQQRQLTGMLELWQPGTQLQWIPMRLDNRHRVGQVFRLWACSRCG
jgi:hypothetical protein